ncbi:MULTISPECIES: ATP-dependent helicase [Micromonospora]|uniref:DNA 3'-5' helicase n=1 Tax=Micromonospora solifontis TaxID=2487138 RepID=A0ABX9WIG1_9ACTN|nr:MULTISPECIES: UvrD-helicase domain-containing protein [Micromonospora]NES15356.1 ATP-dependent helicase [Micromonospora sp. PPF5-17B]NES36147.1 ATP-dependent helicase [Micromonospora solifontis]NES56704.1 ATP-dependent helicase [Micromonospora sp. PPF5-6]RNL99900.1 ATP-dependent helicase [Micromonospora solifontis]
MTTQPTLFGAGAAPAPRAADAGPRYTPVELAKLLRLPAPTREQAAIIAAPVEPLLVVAGAGSGKTETMAARVVWLVANQYVRPEQVLGLTFTRKAAGELAHRVRTRLDQLIRRLGRQGRDPHEDPLTGEPTVSTYHSYAGRIVTEHGLRAGYEPTTRLLTEASRWQLVDLLVRNYDGDMSEVDRMPSTITDAVLALAGELDEHLVDPDDLAAWTGRFFADVQSRPGRVYADVKKALQLQRTRLKLLPLVRAYARRKDDFEAMDFADQLARAARVARDHPGVGVIERDRFRVVLLDEYQDTSHAQVVLLNALFGGGHPVTAVGDPCQSIYGWRGASAGTLDRFPTEFARADGTPAEVLSLTTSWRNRPEILGVANALSVPLRAAGARVPELHAALSVREPIPHRSPRGRAAGTVHCALLETYADEADWIADSVLAAWRGAAGTPGALPEHIPVPQRPTTAVLVRVRSQIPAIESALRARGLPVDVVGLGGLLDTPEVRDVVCTLRVLADPTDGAALLRLLTGARWRIGPRDLVALHRRAKAIARARRELAGEGGPEITVDALDEATLVEALADLGPAQAYSAEGYARLRAYGMELALLRYRLDQSLPELIADIERTIGLDVEVAVRAGRDGTGDAGLARGHLDALGDVAARFSGETPGATLAGFLAYLAAAEDEERGLTPGEVEVVEGAVQILTAHAAKGLEWDVVAVAGLSRGVWPGPVRNSDHWLGGLGVLPFPLRGDADGLPELGLTGAGDQRGVARALEDFTDAWRAHDEREERRLAYVAVTRPRRLLLCSGHWWGEGTKRFRGPSVFLREVHDACLDGTAGHLVDEWAPEPAPDAVNPTTEQVLRAEWPADPLGARRPALAEAAALVRRYLADPDAAHREAAVLAAGAAAVDLRTAVEGAVPAAAPPADDAEVARWRREADLLLTERAELLRGAEAVEVELPGHLSVTQLVALRRDPAGLARTLRRPMPSEPNPYARRGTAFHTWLEQRFGADRLLDVDELPGAADEDAAPDEALTDLQERFLASEWADRVPVEVEVPFATVIAGVVVRGRMDAVFARPGGRYDVVDWKTGRQPTGREAEAAAVQLAVYRLAWAELAGVPVERVGAAFHYVRDGVTVRPADLLDADGLTALVGGVPEISADGRGVT